MYILTGDPKEVAKVLQENRIRIDRGVIKFTPWQSEQVCEPDVVATLREELESTEVAMRKQVESHISLKELAGEIVTVVVGSGQTLPEDIVARLETFGIVVPQIENTAENSADIVLEEAPNVLEMENVNNGILEDMKEVNLDDVKDVPECDTKEAPVATAKKSRAKKTE